MGATALEGLVAHLKFEGNALDELDNVVAPSLCGDATFGPGVDGQALVLDGYGDYVLLGPEFGAVMQPLTSFSTSVWVNVVRVHDGQHDWPRVWQFGNPDNNQYVALLAFHSVDVESAAGGPRFELKDADRPDGKATNLTVNAPGDAITENEWAHIVTVLDADRNYMAIYVNGELVVDNNDFTRNPSMVDLYDENKIGTTSLILAKNYLAGSVDDLKIYNRFLSADEIDRIMIAPPPALAGKPRPRGGAIDVPQELVLTWRAGDYVEGLSPKHRVFFSENFDDVNDGIGGIEQDIERYPIDGSLKLDLGKRCYWRVDEANSTTGWDIGAIWQFTIIDHLVVDDFESYNDLDPGDPESNRIFNTWIDGYEQPANGAIVGYADPPFTERNIIHSDYSGKQSMPYYYDNAGMATYSQAQRAFSPAQDWTREDIGVLSLWFRGYPAYVGSFVEAPAGTYTMTGSGTDIWDKADEFHFAYKELSGSGAIIAKVESVENTDPWAKAGVMIRDTLELGSTYAAVLVTPENGVRFQYRKTAGDSTDRYFAEGITAPQWVRLERTAGGLVRAYYSADGTTWTPFNLLQVRMSMPVYIGLAVTSHNPDAVCEAKFSNVSFPDTSVDPQWTDQDVGMLSNGAEPMYVIVGDGSGTAATVYHDDPNAPLLDTWTEWNIPLTDFSNAGVVLTDVDKMSIGFGDKSNPQPSVSGLMYFDDIRLYLPR
jgi:hypothetical protein